MKSESTARTISMVVVSPLLIFAFPLIIIYAIMGYWLGFILWFLNDESMEKSVEYFLTAIKSDEDLKYYRISEKRKK